MRQEGNVIANTQAVPPILVDMGASKLLRGRALKENEFEFVLRDRIGKVLEHVGNGKDCTIDFKPRRFSRTGTFLYIIEEVQGTFPGLRYDKTVYTAKITAAASGGNLTSRWITSRTMSPTPAG